MRRRELMLLLVGMMTATRALRAQQKAMPVIGYLSAGSPDFRLAAFAANVGGMPTAAITVTRRRTRSAARAGN